MPDFLETLDQIQSAPNARGVVALLHQYLASLTAEDVQQLPWGLSPDHLRAPSDVAMWTLYVRRGQLAGEVGGAAYGRLAKLLSEAADRIAQLGDG
jgi:hypothetical protein